MTARVFSIKYNPSSEFIANYRNSRFNAQGDEEAAQRLVDDFSFALE